jgi:hypothetical protein
MHALRHTAVNGSIASRKHCTCRLTQLRMFLRSKADAQVLGLGDYEDAMTMTVTSACAVLTVTLTLVSGVKVTGDS